MSRYVATEQFVAWLGYKNTLLFFWLMVETSKQLGVAHALHDNTLTKYLRMSPVLS